MYKPCHGLILPVLCLSQVALVHHLVLIYQYLSTSYEGHEYAVYGTLITEYMSRYMYMYGKPLLHRKKNSAWYQIVHCVICPTILFRSQRELYDILSGTGWLVGLVGNLLLWLLFLLWLLLLLLLLLLICVCLMIQPYHIMTVIRIITWKFHQVSYTSHSLLWHCRSVG